MSRINKLYKAVIQGDIEKARSALRPNWYGAAADVHADDEHALFSAVRNGDLDMVKLLIAAGADVNGGAVNVPPYYQRPLEIAVLKGDIEMARVLVGAHADPNAPLTGGASHLREAVERNDVGMVRVLLAGGARPNDSVRRHGYCTALLDAVCLKNTEMVKVLVDAHADVTVDDYLVMIHAARLGCTDISAIFDATTGQDSAQLLKNYEEKRLKRKADDTCHAFRRSSSSSASSNSEWPSVQGASAAMGMSPGLADNRGWRFEEPSFLGLELELTN
jgi:hypothetical protein